MCDSPLPFIFRVVALCGETFLYKGSKFRSVTFRILPVRDKLIARSSMSWWLGHFCAEKKVHIRQKSNAADQT